MKKILLSLALILPLAMNAQDPVPTVVLDTVSKPLTLQDGDVVSGTLQLARQISIADGATITLFNASINGDSTLTGGSSSAAHKFSGLTCDGDATIIIKGDNTVRTFKTYYAGIFIPKDKTLTFQGDGSLWVCNNETGGAAIGGVYAVPSGNIHIESGNITAISWKGGGAAIGAGNSQHTGLQNNHAPCGDIVISGGTVNAICKQGGGAGIGGGYQYASYKSITISGGVVNASSKGAAAIGTGAQYAQPHEKYPAKCGPITITGGTVTASADRAGIGTGNWATHCDIITISGGDVTATSTLNAGIGSAGTSGVCDGIIISGGTVTATGHTGIGCGSTGSCGDITISGGTVTATTTGSGAGIGAYNSNPCGNILISGGNVTATSNGSAAAIGGGAQAGGTCASITITDGVESLVAINTSQYNHNAIGHGGNNNCGPVTIYGQEVEAGKITNDVTFPLQVNDAASNNCAALAELVGIPFPQAIINRTLYRDGYFSTLCLPFDLSEAQIAAGELADAELYSFQSAEYDGAMLKLSIAEETSIVAGKPYLVRFAAGGEPITALTFSEVTVAQSEGLTDEHDGVQFVGTIGRTTLPKDQRYLFLGGEDKLNWSSSTDNSSMKGFRAYFIVNGGTVPAQHAPARIVIVPKTPTALDEISQQPMANSQKLLKDGRLVIIKNGVRYNAQGQIIK